MIAEALHVAWRTRLLVDIGAKAAAAALLEARGDERLAALMTNFVGQCPQSLFEAFDGADEQRPALFVYAGCMAPRAAQWHDVRGEASHAAQLLASLRPTAGLITVVDGHSATLSWLGGVRGQRVSPLGAERFEQPGDLPDLHAHYRIGAEAICAAAAELYL